jgi:phosphoglycolate phosphatase
MRPERTVLFDLDGTLTDPKLGITRCIQHAMSELGRIAPHADDLHWCIGPPARDTFSKLLETTDDTVLDRALALYRERFSTTGLYENTLYPTIPGVLAELRGARYRLFVATSKLQVFATRIVEHFSLTDMFEKVYGSELDGQRADKGELIAHLLTTENLEPSAVVMVGDREHDVVGAKKSGVPCVGVTYGYGTEAELKSAGAVRLVTSPTELLQSLKSLFE